MVKNRGSIFMLLLTACLLFLFWNSSQPPAPLLDIEIPIQTTVTIQLAKFTKISEGSSKSDHVIIGVFEKGTIYRVKVYQTGDKLVLKISPTPHKTILDFFKNEDK